MLQPGEKYTVFVACQIYQRIFYNSLETKITSPSVVTQQAETAGKSVAPCFTLG